MGNKYCLVAINGPVKNTLLTYRQNSELGELARGTLVKVPLGRRKIEGCIVDSDFPEDKVEFELSKIKPVDSILTDELRVADRDLALYEWMSKYYHYGLGKLIFDSLPKIMKRPRELKREQGLGREFPFALNNVQQQTFETLMEKLGKGFSRSLVHGVTGSGKTVVYLSLIQELLARGESVLFLLPEINLTPQFITTFVEHLGAPIYSYNSAISNSDKYGLWKLLQEDDSPKVIIGVRSSIFLPIPKLGMIVVDEEHDQSFKQDDRCPYNARDIALKKGSLLQIPVVLGSATPSMEIYTQFKESNAPETKYFAMSKRIGTSKLPDIELVDMRFGGATQAEISREREFWPFASRSIDEIKSALDKNEQVLVFVNRLGFANYLQCRSCGHQFFCPNCSTSLKYFKKRNEVSCHHCEYKEPAPEVCPECQNMTLHQKGFGTERLQEVLQNHFPTKRVERFDRDEIKNFTQLEERLNDFHSGEIDILVGTQMLSKGHNFRKVNLVLILGIDAQLNFPDFRANERVYQLLTQVSGRSGRFGSDSRVLIHTLSVENKIFEYVKSHSFDGFYEDEIFAREICHCPPYSKLAMIYLSSKFQNRVIEHSMNAAALMRRMTEKFFPAVEILGPRPAVVEKKVNKFTWSIMLRSGDVNQLHNLINGFLKHFDPDYSISVKLDVDPHHID